MKVFLKGLLFFVVSLPTMQATIILCDLGGTCVDVSYLSYALEELGIPMLLAHGVTNNFSFSPREKMFAALEKIGGGQSDTTHAAAQPLPKIYCDWMAGMYTDPTAIRAFILEKIDALYADNFFTTYFEYEIVRNAVKAMFTPEKLVKHQYCIEAMFKLFEKIDKNTHTLVAVTNWDPFSYPLFLESAVGKRLLTHIEVENMVVSGYIKHNKPHDEFYHEIFRRYGPPESTDYLFIDNEPKNIAAAQKFGIPSILFTGDVLAIEFEFKNRGIIDF